MAESRGRIAYSATYRPLVPLDLCACPVPPTSKQDELHLTDGKSYNYNGRAIPPGALKAILKRPKLASEANDHDVDKGRVSGLVFVSERTRGLETLHFALRFKHGNKVKVFCFADIYDAFDGARLEDSPCFAGDDYLVYVSTMEPAVHRRQPWTAVYKTNLVTGETLRLTPPGQADLSPSVSPNGKTVAMASYEKKGGWEGEVEYQRTDIFVMNVEGPSLERKLVVEDGGWPTWGNDNVLFFHRQDLSTKKWGVFRADLTKGLTSNTPHRVTPDDIDAITPVAIDATNVAVVTIREKSTSHSDSREEAHYRHVEIFDSNGHVQPTQITRKINPKADHYNPFLIVHNDGKMHIGYHRSKSELLKSGNEAALTRPLDEIHCPHTEVGLFRVPGIFPAFARDGLKLAYVDNEFKEVWIANKDRAHKIYTAAELNSIFSPVWNQNPDKHILYVCMGPAFKADQTVNICAINTNDHPVEFRQLTKGFNNAFPSTNPEGTRLVYRSTRDGYKNLYIMEDAEKGEEGKITRLTNGPWLDTHCEWSPRGDWIAFSSTRDKPKDAPELDPNAGQDPGWFAAFIVKADDPDVVVRVVASGYDIGGHVNHPFFSPDMKNMVITADLAAVSCDPISLPHFLHSVRPYGDVFMVEIDADNIHNNKDLKEFKRITHSKYENGIATWSVAHHTSEHTRSAWSNFTSAVGQISAPLCPFVHPDGGQGWHNTGHLMIPKRLC